MALSPRDYTTAVPSFFKCPISLELMEDPVVLCTGQTYDRCTIELWLETGNTTCPSTMLQLESLEVVPNHTLRRLIQEWCSRSRGSVDAASRCHNPTANVTADPQQIAALVQDVEVPYSSTKLGSLKKLRSITLQLGERNHRCVHDAGGLTAVTEFLASCADSEEFLEECEEAFAVIVDLMTGCNSEELKEHLVRCGGVVVPSMTSVLCKGDLDSRVNVAIIVAAIAASPTGLHFHSTSKVFESLIKLLREALYPKAVKASLRALLALCRCRSNRILAIEAGVIPVLIELLPEFHKANAERALGILELMCAMTEGRAAVMDHDLAMAAFVSQIHTISVAATEHIVNILWFLCRNSPESLAAAQEVGIFAPLLLLLQIQCTPMTRHKCGELLKQVKISAWNEISCDPHFFLPFITIV